MGGRPSGLWAAAGLIRRVSSTGSVGSNRGGLYHQLLELKLLTNVLALVDAAGDRRIAAGRYRVRIGGKGSGATRAADFATTAFEVHGADQWLWRLSEARQRWEARRGLH